MTTSASVLVVKNYSVGSLMFGMLKDASVIALKRDIVADLTSGTITYASVHVQES